MTGSREQEVEIQSAPRFAPGAKVHAVKPVKNDGTYPHRDIGEVLVRKGDVGYVRDIGTFLQRYYVYAVEFIDRPVVVGMRGYELAAMDQSDVATDAAPGATCSRKAARDGEQSA